MIVVSVSLILEGEQHETDFGCRSFGGSFGARRLTSPRATSRPATHGATRWPARGAPTIANDVERPSGPAGGEDRGDRGTAQRSGADHVPPQVPGQLQGPAASPSWRRAH